MMVIPSGRLSGITVLSMEAIMINDFLTRLEAYIDTLIEKIKKLFGI